MSAAGLVWLGIAIAQYSGAQTRTERVVMFLLPFSCYASGATIGNGQLGLHVLVALLAGILVIACLPSSISRDLLGAALILFALVKPSMTAPFFWLVVTLPRGLRPALFVMAGYGVLTGFALMFQNASADVLFRGWIANASAESSIEGYADVHKLLATIGMASWSAFASLTILGASGVWVYLKRRSDLWLRIGVLALVSRFWAHHRWYDDMLVVLAVAAVVHLREPITARIGALHDMLLAAAVISLLAPGGLYLFGPPFQQIYIGTQLVVWIGLFLVLLFATDVALREPSDFQRESSPATPSYRAVR